MAPVVDCAFVAGNQLHHEVIVARAGACDSEKPSITMYVRIASVTKRIPPNQFLLSAQLEACQRDFPKEPGRFRQAPDCPKAISREQEAGASKSVAARKIMSTANIKVDDDPSRSQKRERGGLLVQMLHMQTTLP
jgi:hypothetical protein